MGFVAMVSGPSTPDQALMYLNDSESIVFLLNILVAEKGLTLQQWQVVSHLFLNLAKWVN